jgi:hypothetical protein
MKISKFIIVFFFLSFTIIYGQDNNNAIAKIRYQEAEELYEKGSYELSLKKLEQVESLLNSSNSKILYLKILIEDTLWRRDDQNMIMPYKPTLQIKNDIQYFIDFYYSASEEKLATVMKISEHYQHLPLSFEDYKVMFEKRKEYWVKQLEIEELNLKNQNKRTFQLENEIKVKIRKLRRRYIRIGIVGISMMIPIISVGIFSNTNEFYRIKSNLNVEDDDVYGLAGGVALFGLLLCGVSASYILPDEGTAYTEFLRDEIRNLKYSRMTSSKIENKIKNIKDILDKSHL